MPIAQTWDTDAKSDCPRIKRKQSSNQLHYMRWNENKEAGIYPSFSWNTVLKEKS